MPRGGKRPGAGRPRGSKNKATSLLRASLSEIAREHSETAVDVLVDVARNGESESTRVAAANSLLDRAFGRTPQGFDMVPASKVLELQEKMAEVTWRHCPNHEVAQRIADAWMKIEIKI